MPAQPVQLADPPLGELAARYGLAEVRDCRVLHAGTSNVVFRLTTTDRVLAVRRLLRSEDEMGRQHALVEYLGERGFPAVPPLRTRSGEALVRLDGSCYALYPLVEGERPAASDARTAVAAGRALAHMHELTARYADAPPNPRETVRERFLRSSSRLPARAEAALREPDLIDAHEDARWLGAYVTGVARELSDVDWPELPAAIIHGDFRADNMIFRDGSLAAVLDLDLATRDARVTDLAVAVHYLARREDSTGLLEPSLVSVLLAAYEEMVPLTPAERRALPVLVKVKAARAPMRMLRHVVKADRDDRPALVRRLDRDVRRLRALADDSAWRRALAEPAPVRDGDL